MVFEMSQLAAGGFFIVKTMASFTTKGQTAYAQAGGVATEVISSIRTVASFSGSFLFLSR